jgi:DNA-binding winged helix-turn-helix (wHTH) protein
MLINNRFEVNPSRSEILDRATGKLVRLEPRQMKLLRLLIENHEQIVTREFIVKQIWDDFPGAGEGLNQSISWLRKLLHDEQKQLIETLPKMGYCFHGSVKQSGIMPGKKSRKIVYLLSALFLITLTVFMFLYYRNSGKKSQSDNLSREESMRISKIDSAKQAERLKAGQNPSYNGQ